MNHAQPSFHHVARSFLHDLFTRFDALATRFNVHKIETVGCASPFDGEGGELGTVLTSHQDFIAFGYMVEMTRSPAWYGRAVVFN